MQKQNIITYKNQSSLQNYSFNKKEKLGIFIIKIILIITCIFLSILLIKTFNKRNNFYENFKEKIYFDQYETARFNEIKDQLLSHKCSSMWDNQREFINGIIRKFKPKKVIEIGVEYGGSSIIILNAIKDIKNSKLYSIDLNSSEEVGKCVQKYFPQFLKKYTLFTGNMATEFIEKIGKNIDIAMIDSAHLEPGEILDFLIILPFLKENAVIIFHDIANQITVSRHRNEWAPYLIFNGIRGKKFLPSGNRILTHDIGAVILEGNQKNYYHDYFRMLGGQWQYFPKEIYINSLRNHFKKYYDKDCLFMFEEAVKFNRKFVKRNPKKSFYKYNSD